MTTDNPKPAGDALDWNPTDLDRICAISDEDVVVAKAVYARLAPKAAKKLLDARLKSEVE